MIEPTRQMALTEALSDRRTQQRKIEDELIVNGSCSAHDMLMRHGITRTAARIDDLRRAGWNIKTLPQRSGKMAVYLLVSGPPGSHPFA